MSFPTPPARSYHLPRIAGQGVAAELLLTGRPMAAERAFSVGLVNELAADDTPAALEAAARGLAAGMLACSARGLQLTKAQLSAAADGGSLATLLSLASPSSFVQATITSNSLASASLA